MGVLKFDKFRGQVPAIAKQHLADGYAQVAENCKLGSGNLKPYRNNLATWTPSKAGDIETIFLYAGQFWFHWLDHVHCVRGAMPSDTVNKVYWTGDGAPKMTEATIATAGGGTDYPTNYYDLGIPAPISAPTLSKSGTPAGNEETRIYVYTYVSAYGEEGPPSAPSETLVVEDDETVDVTTLTGPITGNYNIVSKRIYRVNAGDSSSEFQLVSERPLAETVYNDSKESTSLAEVLPTEHFALPPEDLSGLTTMANGIMAGFVGKDVYFCEPYQPHAWPTDYILSVEDNIVGLGSYGNSLLVVTDKNPVIITGDVPGEMSVDRSEISQAGVSAKGIVDLGYGIAYPSPDGLMVAGMTSVSNVTAEMIDRDSWQALRPESIIGVCHDDKYFGFYDNGVSQGGFIIDPKNGFIVFLDTYASCGYSDAKTDNLYLVVNNNIVQFDAGATNMTTTWKSGVKQVERPVNFGAARVNAVDYPVSIKVFADGAEVFSYSVPDNTPFRLPSTYLADRFEVELSGATEVEDVSLAFTMRDLRGVS